RAGWHEQQESVRGECHRGRKGIIEAAHSPRVGGVRRIKKLHWAAADVLELDELIPAGRRMIHDFRYDHRPDARPGVGSVQGWRHLRRELFLAGTDDVASESHSGGRRPEAKAMAITSQVGGRAGGEKIDGFAFTAELKAIRSVFDRIEIRFV